MDHRSQPVAARRVAGTVVLFTGLLISLLTLLDDGESAELYVFASFMVVIGVGLRIEAAILATRTP